MLEQATPVQRSLVAAYARGVNAGLGSLRSRPWEYWVLHSQPAPWRAEDTILVVHAMWWDLQYSGFRSEILRQKIEARLGKASCFFYPDRSGWDAPNVSSRAGASSDLGDCPAVPAPEALDVFSRSVAPLVPEKRVSIGAGRSAAAGSNNWAVAGRLTANGGALVANDMHLNLRVPTTWYRARLKTGAFDLNGLTLPGAPVLVAGSNGHIAWGFTNSYGDWLDLDTRPCDSQGPGVRFADADERGQCWFAHWLATVPAATNLRLLDFETTQSVAQALTLAPQIGIPQQNLVVGDRAGHIAWTIAGRIPQSRDPGRNDGPPWLTFAEHPRIFDPAVGRVWTANALATDDPHQGLAIGGDEASLGAGYDLGARAKQIRDDLLALKDPATPADMRAIQLDDRARFLARWRALALDLLDGEALGDRPRRTEFKHELLAWNGRASSDSVGYRLVRDYRNRTELAAWQMLLQALDISVEDAPLPAKFERPLWTLVTAQPRHLLAANYGNWREFLLTQIDATISASVESCGSLAQCSWGKRNSTQVRHPLSGALPFLSALIDMPVMALPGDHDMPRVQDGAFGASGRFAVTPGRESQGYMHIAGGQSGHPLSPYYKAGFREWAEGKALPFLPGATTHRLVLRSR